MSGALKLWFFRDLSDEQRLKLFALFGLPVDEIGKVHGRQEIALRHIIQKLVGMVRDEATPPSPQPSVQANDFEVWAKKWHQTCETMCVLLGINGSGSPEEILSELQDRLTDPCPTCHGTGKEGRHSLCRDCDEIPSPPTNLEASDFLHRLVENAFSWGKQDCNYLNPKHIDAFIAATRNGMPPEAAAAWVADGLRAPQPNLEGSAE